jgi:hypothetical protein
MLGITALYHSIGHSLLFAVVAVPVALSGRAGLAAAVGWVLHLLLDTLHVFLNGRSFDAAFLFWPFVENPDPLALPPGSFFWYYVGSPSFYLEVAFWVTVVGATILKWRGWTPPFRSRSG